MAINIGTRLEPFWDEYLLDTEKTTAALRVGHPVRKNTALTCGEAWEGDGCDYYNLIKDGDLYRLYYLAWEMLDASKKKHTTGGVKVCYAESRDGVTWEKPNLGMVSFDGSTDNNILYTSETLFGGKSSIDNFFVFIDENPAPSVKGRCKAAARENLIADDGKRTPSLALFASDDGLHFTKVTNILSGDAYDSLNTVHYNPTLGKYLCYVRGFHAPEKVPEGAVPGEDVRVRDIRVMESEDFLVWSESKVLDFGSAEDVPLYTNAVSVYSRAPQILTGFPSRYIERRVWTPTFDRLGGAEKRRERSAIDKRYGLAVTDCVFMCSRDGRHFRRFDEAFGRNEPENGRNWVYGDFYPCVGMVETPSDIPGADPELSLYISENHWMGLPTELVRYTVRLDGFASLHADFAPVVAVTKPLVFEGNTMLLNFATSARGYIFVTVKEASSGKSLRSFEIFGNKTGRVIDFEGDLAAFSGKEVILTFEMCDADIYSMRFKKQ